VRRHAAPGGACQRGGDATAGHIVLEDIGLEINLLARGIDCSLERRKIFAAANQKLHVVAGAQGCHTRTMVVDKTAWSDMRDHG
jgi:hypothetical protein